MALEIKGVEGDTSYIWYQLAQGTEAGHSVEYSQFVDRFLQGVVDPVGADGVQGSFFVNTADSTLFFKQNNTTEDSAWIQIASGVVVEAVVLILLSLLKIVMVTLILLLSRLLRLTSKVLIGSMRYLLLYYSVKRTE